MTADGSGLVYSTVLGGSGGPGEDASGVAVDNAGHSVIVGATLSSNFPVTPNADQPTYGVLASMVVTPSLQY